MNDPDKEKAMAEKDAVLDLQKSPGWDIYLDAMNAESTRIFEEALKLNDPVKVFSLVREIKGIRTALEQVRWIIERGTKAEKEAG